MFRLPSTSRRIISHCPSYSRLSANSAHAFQNTKPSIPAQPDSKRPFVNFTRLLLGAASTWLSSFSGLVRALAILHLFVVAGANSIIGRKQILNSFVQSFSKEFAPYLNEIRRLGEEVGAEIHLAKAFADYQEQRLQVVERAAAAESRATLGAFLPNAERDFKSIKTSQALQHARKSGWYWLHM